MKFIDHKYAPYSRQNKELSVDPYNPPLYNLNSEHFNVFSQITSTDPTIADITIYFEGVYVQTNYDLNTKQPSYDYLTPIPCSQVYSGITVSDSI